MALTLTEGAVDALNTYLQANMAAKLTALNTAYNDGITLAAPAAYYLDEMSLEEVPSFPIVFILGRRATVERYNASFTDATHEIDIGVMVLEQTSETLQRRLYRYMRAIWELVVERFFATTADDFATTSGADVNYSPVYARDKAGPYLADACLTVHLNKQEDKA